MPATLDERDYERITGSDAWIARKLDSNRSCRLLNMLDKKGVKTEKALISIVITTCNRSTGILKRAVKSAVDQTYANKEIIVINDGAGNEDIIRNALAGFKEVRFVQNTGEHGVSNVRNLAVDEARGKYLAFLDDDDEWLPEKLELQYEAADDDTGLVYCDYYAIKDGKVLRSDDSKEYPRGEVFSKLLGSNFVGGCSIPLIKKEALLKAGKFDTNISFGEDYDMWLRIAKEYKVGCVPRRLMKYYIGKESLTQSFERRMDGWEYLLDKYSGDFKKHPDAYKEYTSTNVREAAKRASLKYSAGVWKKYGNTGEYIKGIIMKILRVY
ncbi:MAG: glycosyltransferase family 2 protein [Lachnospiraceae bacterium]|nr:glycosyltransferase family 2 protein [Lachnospiraceae bacterium]